MKRLLSCILVLGFAGLVNAGEIDHLRLVSTAVGSNTTAIVTNTTRATGLIRSLSAISAGGSATVTVTTALNKGSSLGTVKTVLPAIVVGVAGMVTNFAANQFIADDQLVIRADNASITSSVTPEVVLIYEQ